MAEVGTNPARIFPAWQQFVAEHSGEGRTLRGIGEPIWAERSPAELAECQRHEALLNACFDDPDFLRLCPYDTTALGAAVVEQARRNHPFVSTRGRAASSSSFPGAALADNRVDDLVLTVHELATNSVRHGGGEGTLSLWPSGFTSGCGS